MNSSVFRSRVHVLFIVAVLASFGLSLWSAGITRAAGPITVTSFADSVSSSDGKCTLREAIIAANKDVASGSKSGECPAGSGADTIILLPGTYTLSRTDNGTEDSASTGDLDIKSSVVISPTGPVTITAISSFTDRIFQVLTANVTITGVTISGGNSGYGGAIHNGGTLTVSNSTLTNNKATYWGGGIKNAGSLTLTNVTISGNSSKQDGGGLYNLSGTATLTNVTITNNTADSDSNGSGNGGGVFRSGGTVNVKNTLIAGNLDKSSSTKHPDCYGALTSQGNNLVGIKTSSCSGVTNGVNGDQAGTTSNPIDPKLGSLQNNGGPTFTHALLTGSPAIDAGTNTGCPATDQRGQPRPQGAACDIGAFESGQTSAPVLFRAIPNDGGTTIVGWQNAGATLTLKVYTNTTCGSPNTFTFLGSAPGTTTDAHGYFQANLPAVSEGAFVVATATDSNGNTSGFSPCLPVGAGNDSWPDALALTGSNPISATVQQYLDLAGQSRWYKFTVQPNSQLIVVLTGKPPTITLPANYDLTIYKNIAAAYQTLVSPQDLVRVGAEFAQQAFSQQAFSQQAFSQQAFSQQAFSQQAFSQQAFSQQAFSQQAFSQQAFSQQAFSQQAFSPDEISQQAFSQQAFSQQAFSQQAFSQQAFSPGFFDPAAFSSAQTRSLIGVSAFEGTASEGVILNTWNNSGDFYVRVRGRDGAFSLQTPFQLQVVLLPGNCGSVNPITTDSTITPTVTAGNYQTIILTDLGRMAGTPDEKATLWTRLNDFAARPEVSGAVVNVGSYVPLGLPGDARVIDANFQADNHFDCPYAKNIVAGTIKEIVDRYRALNASTLKYVVIAGNDAVIPFFRYPDQAGLGPESLFIPPVFDFTASQASLKLNYVLSQDEYGAPFDISLQINAFPIPGLAVGRLVETAADATTMVDAYMITTGGVVTTPTSSLVTGYDFLEDAANAVQGEFVAGLGAGATTDTLITPNNLSPDSGDPRVWTATTLSNTLLSARHDLVYLAGHFRADSALAADFKTSFLSTDLAGSSVNLKNAIIFSAGCHSGYNIVNEDAVPGFTFDPDWAQAFARKGATLIAGTGYQYGDTDFLEYSERLYLGFAQQLRTGSGPVSVGQALVAAKQAYLASTPQLGGIHQKALLEATLFGLPMLKVDMPGTRLAAGSGNSIVTTTNTFGANPGAALGLTYADISVASPVTPMTVTLQNVDDNSTVTATYLSGNNGVVTNPGEPALPLEVRNVTVPSTVLRGVGFVGGSYNDLQNKLPLIGVATTEIRGIHGPFLSDVFYPVRLWKANYFDALNGGATRLLVTPGQFQSGAPGSAYGTLRGFSQMDFRLYYSNNISDTIALATAPTIVQVSSSVSTTTVNFNVNVVGNPAAGIQEVWVTSTDISSNNPGTWQSLYLTQSLIDSTLWTGTLSSPTPANIRYMVQAVNGVGLVSMATNLGAYYTPGVTPAPSQPTTLELNSPPPSGKFGTQITVNATLKSGGTPLGGQRIIFGLGAQSRQAVTDLTTGVATATLPLLEFPSPSYEIRAIFAGAGNNQPSYASSPFEITKQNTLLSLSPSPATGHPGVDLDMSAILSDTTGQALGGETVFFRIVKVGDNTISKAVTAFTDFAGRARPGRLSLPLGNYTVDAFFSGSIPVPGGTLVLEDARYLSSTAAGSLALVNAAPAAVDNTYNVNEEGSLSVAAPGVLGNDTDADHDPLTALLVSGPVPDTAGELNFNSNGAFVFTPTVDFNGPVTFTYKANDGFVDGNTATVTITVNAVNDAPSFTQVGDQVVNEDAGPQTVTGWATGISAGSADESSQTLTFNITGNDNVGLFSAGPAVAADGTLTYTPAPDTNGVAHITLVLKDNGGTDNGGVDTSGFQPFTITVNAVNDAPSFTQVGDQVVNEDAGPQTVTGWATGISAGPANESGQTLTFVVTANDNPGLFSAGPAVAADGTLTYTPAPGENGVAHITLVLIDGGGTANGGVDTSAPQTFVITVVPENHPPDCSTADTDEVSIWSPDKSFHLAHIVGVTDPDGDPVTIKITGIFQDERTGSNAPDGTGVGTDTAQLRAERDSHGDGRVYHISFSASDGKGGMCQSSDVRIGVVPHDQGGTDVLDQIDQGPLYDSTTRN